jgi:hypothetical protein
MAVNKFITDQVNLMRKYRDGRDVEDGDLPYIRELCSVGMMKTGVSLKRRKITAKPIELGLKIIDTYGTEVIYVEPHYPVVPKLHPIVKIEQLNTIPTKIEDPKPIGRFESIIE